MSENADTEASGFEVIDRRGVPWRFLDRDGYSWSFGLKDGTVAQLDRSVIEISHTDDDGTLLVMHIIEPVAVRIFE